MLVGPGREPRGALRPWTRSALAAPRPRADGLDDHTFVLTAYGRGFNEIATEARTVTVAPQRPSPSIPIGAIALWAGDPTDIPPGWRLCDGRSGTPALVDRFVLGAGEHAAAGTSGGGAPHKHAVTVRLTGRTGETPGHHHTRPQGWSTDKAAGNDGPFALAAADRLGEGGAHAHDVAAEIAWSTSEQPAPSRRGTRSASSCGSERRSASPERSPPSS